MTAIAKALVIGGGIGGMAAAIALARQGTTVRLIDIDPEWKVYGAGITITGPTLRAFRKLGLLDPIKEHGYFSIGQRLFLFDGTMIGEQIPPPIEEGLPASGGIMRPKLHQIMSSAVRELAIDVRLGVTANAFDQDGDSVSVRFSDGHEDRFDLVVAADGIYSRTRAALFPDAVKPVYSGQMSWRVVAPRPPEMNFSEFFFGHANIGGIIPCSQTQVYGFILHADPECRRVPDADQANYLRELMADFDGPMAAVRESIGPNSSIVARPFEYALQPKPWHVGRVVMIGDAAHATTPHLASGAGIAVEDALVLMEELAKAGDDVAGALNAFVERRFERCRYVIESSVAIGQRQLEGAPPQEMGMRMGQAMAYLAGDI
ncbi:FAD-dependent monooxygenase [Sphingobium sp. HWE2-09]|uniref:FAD-dependent monooxygenase n=1 Tax=Sphingobium sp. HWE2-09 TaxID=3108390 RepID=UPI002DC0EA9E|nr:FAD-dependent monooxygenase [Sphingobium sp. HWE2-09]